MQEGKKFHAALQDMITWLDEKKQTMQTVEPVSGQKDLLTQQKLEHEVSYSRNDVTVQILQNLRVLKEIKI